MSTASPVDFPLWKNYLDAVPAEGLMDRLSGHLERVNGILAALPADKAGYAYAPGKWTIRQLIGHLLVSHRIFTARAVCIARGDVQEFPGFDENAYSENWPSAAVSLADLAAAYAAESAATRAWLRLLSPEELDREGVAAKQRVTPRQLLRSLIGHESHHLRVLAERYGVSA